MPKPFSDSIDLIRLYQRLNSFFGPQRWWPVIDRKNKKFEICLGAILTQNTAWTNVEKARGNLALAHLLSPGEIAHVPLSKLKKVIRPAGYFNQKAKKLKIFVKFLERHRGLSKLFKQPIKSLRANLLTVWGLGPETVDSIILYAAGKPIFVIDTYTKRLLAYFQIHFSTDEKYRLFFQKRLPRRIKLWKEFHALIVAWGKLYAQDKDRACRLLDLAR